MIYNIEEGDLFKVDLTEYTAVHCISLDMTMGAGIAKEFTKKFPYLKTHLIKLGKSLELDIPVCLYYKDDYGRGIFNLVTKKCHFDKPTYENVYGSIDCLYRACIRKGISKLVMPKIACGLDQKNWDKVEKYLKEKFEDSNIEILVKYREG